MIGTSPQEPVKTIMGIKTFHKHFFVIFAIDVYQNYVVRCEKRDDFAAYLRDSGVEVLISWPTPNHKQEALGLTHFSLPKTERISAEVLSLPMYPELTDDEVGFVVGTVKGFFK